MPTPDLTKTATAVAGRAALESSAQASGLSHSPANEPAPSQSRMGDKEVSHWANKRAQGPYAIVRSMRKEVE